MYVWFIGLNHSKYRFLFHAVYIGIMNAIRKSTFHAARYNWVKYLGSDVRSRPLQSAPMDFFCLSRPEKGLQKRVNLMQQTTNSDLSRHYLPRQLRHLILQEYLSGVKTARQLSEEHGIPMSTIHKMGQRWKAKNSCSFVSTPNPYPIMSRVTSEEASELLSENKALRRRLEEALLRLEGYEIMGDILQEEYGIDLLKKSAAGQSSVSKKDTQQ
jgi:transposase-like protein